MFRGPKGVLQAGAWADGPEVAEEVVADLKGNKVRSSNCYGSQGSVRKMWKQNKRN